MKAKHIHYEMAVVANGFHIPHHDRKALKLLEIFLADQKPEVFIINGDFSNNGRYLSLTVSQR